MVANVECDEALTCRAGEHQPRERRPTRVDLAHRERNQLACGLIVTLADPVGQRIHASLAEVVIAQVEARYADIALVQAVKQGLQLERPDLLLS